MHPGETEPITPEQRWSLRPSPMLYPNEYVWFVFVSSLDIMFTWTILGKGGTEVNPVAREVISYWGLNGAIAFKFSLTLFVIIACEVVGRALPVRGLILARVAVLVSAIPPAWSLVLLSLHTLQEHFG